MPRPDDSTLAPGDLRLVEERASHILDQAAAWDRFPVPVDDILEVANLRVAPTNAFDAEAIVGYAKTRIQSRGGANQVGHRQSLRALRRQCLGDPHRPDGRQVQTAVRDPSTRPGITKSCRLIVGCSASSRTAAIRWHPTSRDQFEREANKLRPVRVVQGDNLRGARC